MQRWIKPFALAAGACAVAAGCGQPGYVSQPTTYHAESSAAEQAQQRWQDPQFVTTRVNERLAQIEQRVRGDIATGQLPAEAINDFNARKARVLQTLAQATQDGMVDLGERQMLRSEVQAAADMSTVQQVQPGQPGTPAPGYGFYNGGATAPQMQPPLPTRSYFDETWQWGF